MDISVWQALTCKVARPDQVVDVGCRRTSGIIVKKKHTVGTINEKGLKITSFISKARISLTSWSECMLVFHVNVDIIQCNQEFDNTGLQLFQIWLPVLAQL